MLLLPSNRHLAILVHDSFTKVVMIFLVNFIVAQLVARFPAFNGASRFVTVFSKVRFRTLSWASLMQSHSSSVFYYTSCLPVGLFNWNFVTNTLVYPMILVIILVILGEKFTLRTCQFYNCLLPIHLFIVYLITPFFSNSDCIASK
jgi:hypothetical protein